MSKTDCDIIKDLLPLYEDNICSEKSKDLIEEHLIECEDCREYWSPSTGNCRLWSLLLRTRP